MKPFVLALTSTLLLAASVSAADIYDFSVHNIDGGSESLKAFKGKTILIVNVASKCGYTPQYAGLQKLYTRYKDKGFVILGFPANNFGAQEPGTNAEIKTFCSRTYNVTFPMFSKISVKGSDQEPLYQYLTTQSPNAATHGDIQWNFTKFLISSDGKIVARFEPDVSPESGQMQKAIESTLQ
jgi:glutathione peroxidase